MKTFLQILKEISEHGKKFNALFGDDSSTSSIGDDITRQSLTFDDRKINYKYDTISEKNIIDDYDIMRYLLEHLIMSPYDTSLATRNALHFINSPKNDKKAHRIETLFRIMEKDKNVYNKEEDSFNGTSALNTKIFEEITDKLRAYYDNDITRKEKRNPKEPELPEPPKKPSAILIKKPKDI